MSNPPVGPVVRPSSSGFVNVRGTFYRAVDPAFAAAALSGSRSVGRYSPADTPTLYLSSSREGVAAAMIKHADQRAAELSVLAFDVEADRIADLRDDTAMAALGVNPSDAFGDWQRELDQGHEPRSWHVRAALETAGARGLIDPSRKRPGLWHLTLFAWNTDGAPRVQPAPPPR
jgi:RES domain-containing protein